LNLLRPRKLSIITALILATLSVLLMLVTDLIAPGINIWLQAVLYFAFILCASFLVINLALDRYFYQNIRAIYYNIHQLRGGSSGVAPKNLPDHLMIPEINKILIEWEKEKREEIGHLKEMEIFRKEFLGNVSHELKTPIFTIQGYIHTLLDGGLEDQEINVLYLQKAAKSLERITSIVEDLEAISRLEGGDLIVEPRTFEIQELISDVIDSLEMRAREKYISLLTDESDKNRYYVFADKDLIRQVLINLLVNSIKYGTENGTSRVKCENHQDFIVVSVSDDGIGIDKKHLPRLFERFYRVDKSRSRDQGGTGLGLAIVKHIIEAHGEKISVESTPGKGSIFSFTLKKSK